MRTCLRPGLAIARDSASVEVRWHGACIHTGQTGYFGWFQRFVSRRQLPADASGVLSVSFKHSEQKGTSPAPQDAIFTKTVYLRSHQSARLPAAVFYFGAAQGRACAVTGDFPCPGEIINQSAAGVGNASCVLRCNTSHPGTETLLLTVRLARLPSSIRCSCRCALTFHAGAATRDTCAGDE